MIPLLRGMENHGSTSSFLVDQVEVEQSSSVHVPLHHTSQNNNNNNNPKRKRSRFSTWSSSGVSSKPKCIKKPPDSSVTRPCTECGKKFWSWKALFGHMRCHPERQWRGINPPPNFRPRHNNVNSPIKKTKLLSDEIMTEEDYEIAACLLLLANGSKLDDNEENNRNVDIAAAASEEPCSSSGRGVVKDCQFECWDCKKVFGSHQALGGHRASHKNVKGCFAASGSGLTTQANLNLNFPPPITLISGEDQYDSSSSYYSCSVLDLRLKL